MGWGVGDGVLGWEGLVGVEKVSFAKEREQSEKTYLYPIHIRLETSSSDSPDLRLKSNRARAPVKSRLAINSESTGRV